MLGKYTPIFNIICYTTFLFIETSTNFLFIHMMQWPKVGTRYLTVTKKLVNVSKNRKAVVFLDLSKYLHYWFLQDDSKWRYFEFHFDTDFF